MQVIKSSDPGLSLLLDMVVEASSVGSLTTAPSQIHRRHFNMLRAFCHVALLMLAMILSDVPHGNLVFTVCCTWMPQGSSQLDDSTMTGRRTT